MLVMRSPWGAAPCAVRAHSAVRKVGYFRPCFPDGQGTNVTTVFPDTGLLRFSLSPKDYELKQTMFHTENSRLLSESAVFALCTYAHLVVDGFQGGHGKASLLLGAVPAPWRNALWVQGLHQPIASFCQVTASAHAN